MNRAGQRGGLIFLILATVCLCALGQTSRDAVRSAPPSREMALAALDAVADELREAGDLNARVRLAEEVVGLLARDRPERCRQLLDALFDEALKSEAAETTNSGRQNHEAYSVADEIIGVAAQFDRKLAASYVERFARAEDEARKQGPSPQTSKASPQAADFYLRLAVGLIEKDPALAVETAGRSLGYGVTGDTLLFLAALRKKDSALANNFALKALESVRVRGGDVNELFVLYAYVFSSPQVPFVRAQGLALRQIPGYASLAVGNPVDAGLSAAYLRAAAQLLLDPARAARMQQYQTVAGDFYFLKITEPRFAGQSQALTSQLAARLADLTASLDPVGRQTSVATVESLSAMQRETRAEPPDLDILLRQATDEPDVERRDRLFYKAVTLALRSKRHDAALEAVEKLSPGTRHAVKPFVVHSVARQLVAAGELEKALRLVEDGDDAAARASISIHAALSLVGKERNEVGRAAELLADAERLSSKLNERERGAILAGVASVYARFDAAHSAQVLQDIIRATNKTDDFAGELKITRTFALEGFTNFYRLDDSEANVYAAFEQHARRDFVNTLADARGIKSRIFRLRAIIAVSRGALTD
ncbi:MAG TPA: hypothetical protein VFS10_10410 [Pyrinomonadaceae bacterium]|nr:hypothetical protein [Pyrinomonadaceae bacterium]